MLGPMGAMVMGKESFTMLSELASYPLTVLYGIQQAAAAVASSADLKSVEERTSLVVHVVGAELAFDCNNLSKWDVFLLNVIPGLRSLYISFSGPELTNVPAGTWDEDLRCPHCIHNSKQFVCHFQPDIFYHNYVTR